MRVFRSTCKRGKIIPLWGTEALRKLKGKKVQRRNRKRWKTLKAPLLGVNEQRRG